MIRLVAVGDMMFSREVKKYIERHERYFISKKIKPFFGGKDILFGNLETPISDVGKPLSGKNPHITFCAPEFISHELHRIGFDVLSIANNHVFDYGAKAFSKTHINLKKHSIRVSGNSINNRQFPVKIKKHNITVGFLSYSYLFGPHIGYAGKGIEGPAKFIKKGREKSITEINELKDKVDCLIVSMHWGHEHVHYPTIEMIEMSHQIIESGADCILGHHPHFVQGIETYNNKLIFYSLGNFIFSEPYKGSRWTVIVHLALGKNQVEIVDIVPCTINENGIPDLVKESDKIKYLKKIDLYSKHLLNKKHQKIIDVSKDYVKYAIRSAIYSRHQNFFKMLPLGIGIKNQIAIYNAVIKDYCKRLR
ncbi:CapA family protein [Desulfobacula toluolica]|uniref:Uncharacterized protein, related to capsule biosynthesis protein CapA n=1 Tax=Desulfobacula toluolica (strain DSM 7467 / Tol2) TaxID=651182 RepID=K0NGV7_DESTT|nr:CapA family protein [Desulfobacula toluolica]CCK80476.1 uncharacterized protein, related to capsule biosynthesis protein CapA [Desulfobacula toluolica Tol2]